MAKSLIKVSAQWRRHFAAPVAFMRLAKETGDTMTVDEDGGLYLLNSSGVPLLSKQLPWIPAAIATDATGTRLAVISASGTLLLIDRNGAVADELRTVLRPTGLDLSPGGELVAVADGAGKAGIIDLASRKTTFFESKVPYHYISFAGTSNLIVAVGQYGQVLCLDRKRESQWQKDYHCHTRSAAIAYAPTAILVPSPHYGLIALTGSGAERGLFDVPDGPKVAAVTVDGSRIYVFTERNELIIFEAAGRILYRQPMGVGVLACDCSPDGAQLTAVMTTGAIERYFVGQMQAGDAEYLELGGERKERSAEGPETLWKTKVFSALGGLKWGQLGVTPSARYVALLDVDAVLRVYDQTGKQAGDDIPIKGRQPAVKASRSTDLVVAASSDNLVALDMRGYRQRRLTLRNEWTTHFDVSPRGIFFAVADFFRGVSIFDETLDRSEYLETGSDVLDVAVDGGHHTLLLLSDGTAAFYNERGSALRTVGPLSPAPTHVVSLGQGFVTAAGGMVQAYDSEGVSAWSIELPGEIGGIQPTRAGLTVWTVEGDVFITNAHGTVVTKLIKRAPTRFFAAAGESRDIRSIEYRGRLLTARSTDSGVLWRKEMDDDILSVEVSPDGNSVAVLAGIYLYLMSSAIGPATAGRQVYLEI